MNTKTITITLIIIALGLWVNILLPFVHPKPVKAGSVTTCQGELKAKAFGIDRPTVGGYNVEMTCY